MAKRKRRARRDKATEKAGARLSAQAASIKAAEPAKPTGGARAPYARLPNTRLAVTGLRAAAKEFRIMVGQRLQAETDTEEMEQAARRLEKQAKDLTRKIKRGRRRGP